MDQNKDKKINNKSNIKTRIIAKKNMAIDLYKKCHYINTFLTNGIIIYSNLLILIYIFFSISIYIFV